MSDDAPALTLPPTPAAPGLARRHVTGLCPDWPPDRLDVVRLLTSELVTNAVVHGTGPITLAVRHTATGLRVDVEDGDPTRPAPSTDSDGLREHGRGLALVAVLADRWGSERRGEGKSVWFELDKSTGNQGSEPSFARRRLGHIEGVRAPTHEEHR